jgi:hypothetical protein
VKAVVPVEDAMARAAAGELLGPRDMAAIFKIKYSRFNALDKQHAWDQFKVRPALGPKQYSGVLVTKYLAGEPLYAPTFGRKRAAR